MSVLNLGKQYRRRQAGRLWLWFWSFSLLLALLQPCFGLSEAATYSNVTDAFVSDLDSHPGEPSRSLRRSAAHAAQHCAEGFDPRTDMPPAILSAQGNPAPDTTGKPALAWAALLAWPVLPLAPKGGQWLPTVYPGWRRRSFPIYLTISLRLRY